MLDCWKENWDKAAELKLIHSKSVVKTHLELGHDVVLPFLVTLDGQIEDYEDIAENAGVNFYEVYIDVPKEEAIRRVLDRGFWGEPGMPPFTEKDYPEIESLFDRMYIVSEPRTQSLRIYPKIGDVEDAYKQFLDHLS